MNQDDNIKSIWLNHTSTLEGLQTKYFRLTCHSNSLRTVDEKCGFSQLQYCTHHRSALMTSAAIVIPHQLTWLRDSRSLWHWRCRCVTQKWLLHSPHHSEFGSMLLMWRTHASQSWLKVFTYMCPSRHGVNSDSNYFKFISLFLFQRLSVLIQQYNAILLHDCFVKEEEEQGSFQLDFCTFCIA